MQEKMNAWSQTLFQLLQNLVAVMTIVLLLFTFAGRVYAVDGASMLPTLQDSAPILIQKAGYTPAAGDIVVLVKPTFRDGDPIVKRIIATGGQSVDIDYASNTVFVDGEALAEPYILEPMREFPPEYAVSVQVPPGSIFVMGDNRNGSGDSRDPALGVVDVRYVMGRVLFVD